MLRCAPIRRYTRLELFIQEYPFVAVIIGVLAGIVISLLGVLVVSKRTSSSVEPPADDMLRIGEIKNEIANIKSDLQSISRVLIGQQTRGRAGEYVLDEKVFKNLPANWIEHNRKVNGSHVEYALKLPNSRFVPIDSKWPDPAIVDQILNCGFDQEREKLIVGLQRKVTKKAEEVCKYLDPAVTEGFGIAAIPDSIDDFCPSAVKLKSSRNAKSLLLDTDSCYLIFS